MEKIPNLVSLSPPQPLSSDEEAPASPAPDDDPLLSPYPLLDDIFEQGAHVSTSKHEQLPGTYVPVQSKAGLYEMSLCHVSSILEFRHIKFGMN